MKFTLSQISLYSRGKSSFPTQFLSLSGFPYSLSFGPSNFYVLSSSMPLKFLSLYLLTIWGCFQNDSQFKWSSWLLSETRSSIQSTSEGRLLMNSCKEIFTEYQGSIKHSAGHGEIDLAPSKKQFLIKATHIPLSSFWNT